MPFVIGSIAVLVTDSQVIFQKNFLHAINWKLLI